ncbi:hypothetical protein NBT05_01780 [Aquimarina sp. ERC-38]|uniref:hypothetical protein n=1 Tax=Aquimarina sp. ERC-38 TaxID=2949996 RepID=UPI00224623D4|nr:hypothetical protein [Aquimarina sp. ERC-38]UZO81217.1 hypothetical protein NBT05_01780 [Aquimarina sp. ERC-38]
MRYDFNALRIFIFVIILNFEAIFKSKAMNTSKNSPLSNKNQSEQNEPASISFKQHLESRSNFDYLNPDQKIIDEKRENRSESIDDDIDTLL